MNTVTEPNATLIAHGGARKISRDELRDIPTPEATRTHQPLSHFKVVEALTEALSFRYLKVVRDEYAVSPDGMKMFGVMDLSAEFSGCRFAIGLRNSNDKSMRLALTAGMRVFVCDNMAFSGDFTPMFYKHTRNLALYDAISIAVDRIYRGFDPLEAQVGRMRELELSESQVRLLIYKAFLDGEIRGVPRHLMSVVHDLYFHPQQDAFRPRNLWSLSNAFTSAFKKLAPIKQFEVTARLGAFLTKAEEGLNKELTINLKLPLKRAEGLKLIANANTKEDSQNSIPFGNQINQPKDFDEKDKNSKDVIKKGTNKPKALRSEVTTLMAQPLPAPVNNSTRMTKETVKDLDKWDQDDKQRKAAPPESMPPPQPKGVGQLVQPGGAASGIESTAIALNTGNDFVSKGGPRVDEDSEESAVKTSPMPAGGQLNVIDVNTRIVTGWINGGSSTWADIYIDGTYLTTIYPNCPPDGSNCNFSYTISDNYVDNVQHTLAVTTYDWSTYTSVPLSGSPQNFTFNLVPTPNWNKLNWYTADDAGLQPGMPANTGTSGAGSENFSFSAPIVSLGGRGLDVNLSLNYNSLLWHQENGEVTYDIDKGNPGPGWSLLGIGKMMDMSSTGGAMLEDTDGTRHSYDGTIQAGYYSGTSTYYGHTTDGSFIDYVSYRDNSGITGGKAYLPNGTIITYDAVAADGGAAYPTQIKDRNGNYINIAYVNNQGPNISTITDTEGRVIQFNYDPNNYLLSVTGPAQNTTGIGQNPNSTQTYIRIHHRHQPLSYNFSGLTPLVRDSNPYVIDAIYYPTKNTGYWFGDADSYSTYGMLNKVIEQRGMSWTAGQTAQDQGTFTPGAMTRQMLYNYPLTAGAALTSAPQYTQMTETWANMDTPAAMTAYSVNNNGTPRTTSVTLPNGNTIKQSSYNHPGVWDDGLLYQIETISPASQTLAKSNTLWELGHYSAPRVTEADSTDELNQTTRQTFAYDTVYNQVTVASEFGFSNNLLRKTIRTYENSSSYVGTYSGTIWSPGFNPGRHIFSLVKTEEVQDASNIRLRRTDYTYDGSPLVDTPGVVSYDQDYNTTAPDYYTPPTVYRGNVTNTTVYADAANLAGAIPYDSTYDVTGNARTITTNCCQQMSFVYTTNTQYSQPEQHTKGSSDPNSPDRMTESAIYDFNTGVPVHTTDFNGRQSAYYYDPILRPVQTLLPSGGKTTTSYDDANLSVTETTQNADNTIAAKSMTTVNGRGQTTLSQQWTGTGWNASAVKYDVMGRKAQVSMPYDTSNQPSQWTTYTYDQLSRVTQVTAPDGSLSQTFYNETQKPDSASAYPGNFVRSRDAWGRERWARTDDFGRLAEVVEPNPSGTGSVFEAGSLQTLYHHDQLDQLVGVTQGTQARWFAYDSLGRVTRQKLAEQTATINSAGVYVGANGSGAQWSDAFTYDNRSNLIQRVDARGVKANYNYLVGGGSPDPLNRLQGVSYDSAGADATYPIHGAQPVTLSYMTTGDKTRVQSVVTAYVATETNAYDIEGRISDYTLTFTGRPNNPMQMSYLYDTVNRLTEVRYPAAYGMAGNPRKVVNPGYDETSRLKQLTVDGQIQMNQIVYNPMSQVTSLTTGAATNNADVETYSYDAQTALLTNQKVIKQNSSQTLLDLSYEYNRGLSNGNLNGKTGQLTHIVNNLDRNKDRVFEFDTLGRLRTAKGGGATGVSGVTANWTQGYSFDRYGNRTNVTPAGVTANSQAVPSDGLQSLSYDQPSNRINTAGYLYDLAGNLTKGQDAAGNWQTYEYDQAGRMLRVRDAANNILETNTFAADRNRLINETQTQRTYYAWGGSSVIAEYTEPLAGNTPTYSKSYIYAGSRLLSTFTNNNGAETLAFQHPDRLGTKLVTNPAANTSFEQATLPFGTSLDAETTGTTNQRFTSYDRSAVSGLDYAVNRSYSSAQSRFTQVDPIGMNSASIGNPQSMNLYAYVQNNPVDNIDPSGLDILKPEPNPDIKIKTEYVTVKEDPFSSDDWLRFAADSQELRNGGQTRPHPAFNLIAAPDVSGPVVREKVNGGPITLTTKQMLRLMLSLFLNKISGNCATALQTLGISNQQLLNAFDNNSFVPDPSRDDKIDGADTEYNYTTDPKTGIKTITSTTYTQHGINDFVDRMGYLIHEVSHAALTANDQQIYNALNGSNGLNLASVVVTGDPKVDGNNYSHALSAFFNANCK
ncbi:MAG: RHS repeat-associated core domain-containing protein [Pyrinomonadaceae bacterium]